MDFYLRFYLLYCFCCAALASRVHLATSDDGFWVRQSKVTDHEFISITIALASPDPQPAVQALLSVSDPNSHQYGRFWCKEDVRTKFSSSPEVISLVLSWLHREGVAAQQIHRESGLLHVTGSVYHIQQLLHTTIFQYEHRLTGVHEHGFEHYQVPSGLKDSILWILPRAKHLNGMDRSQPSAVGPTRRPRGLDDCASRVTPSCLRTAYNMSSVDFIHPNNSFGFFLPGWSTWLPSDLDNFFHTHAPQLVGHRPSVVSINGGYRQTDIQTGAYNLEPNMDAEYTSKFKISKA